MIFYRKYGTALTGGTLIWLPLLKASSDDFAGTGDWTPAASDVKISKDGGAQANLATTPSWDANIEMWKFTVSATELQCKQAHIQIRDAATKAIQDDGFIIETFGNASAMIIPDIATDAIGAMDVAAQTGDPGTTVTALAYLKQLVNILIGSSGVATFPAAAAPANGVSLAEAIRYIQEQQQPAAAAALTAYDPPTHAEIATSLATWAGDVTLTVVDDAGNSASTFVVDTDAGSDKRLGMLRLTSGALSGESRPVIWTGTQVTVLTPDDAVAGLEDAAAFSAEPAAAVTGIFRPA